MNVFLTGGTGFIGQSLTRSLLRRGWQVVALVRNPNSPQAETIAKMGAHCVQGDVTERESMRESMKGCDVVIHNAAWYEVGVSKKSRQPMYDINVTGTENVLGLAQELAIPRTIYISSTTYYGDTGAEKRDEMFQRRAPYYFYYEQTKAEAHEVGLKYLENGLPLIIVCPAHVVGSNDHSVYGYFQRLYVNHMMLPIGWAPDIVHSPVHVEDLAEGIVLTVEKGRDGEIYVLAGDSINLRDTLAIWGTKPGGFRVRAFMPYWVATLMFAPMEPILRWLGLPAFLSRETVASTKGSLQFSSAKAQQELGWTYRPAPKMWSDVIDGERQLLQARQKRDIVSRLNPVDAVDLLP